VSYVLYNLSYVHEEAHLLKFSRYILY